MDVLIAEDDIFHVNLIVKDLIGGDETNVRVERTQINALQAMRSGTNWNAAVFDLVLPITDFEGWFKGSKELEALMTVEGGVLLGLAFQEQFPGHPMVLCSSHFGETNKQRLKPLVESGVCMLMDKSDASDAQKNELAKFLKKQPVRAISEAIWDSFLAKPSMLGIGIDLKQLFQYFKERIYS